MAETKWPTPEELEAIYNSTPADEPRSRLEQYRELIFKWRQQGRSYRRIQALLVAHCQLQVSASMLAKFVKTRTASEPGAARARTTNHLES